MKLQNRIKCRASKQVERPSFTRLTDGHIPLSIYEKVVTWNEFRVACLVYSLIINITKRKIEMDKNAY